MRRGGGASRHPVLAIRARKQSLSARECRSAPTGPAGCNLHCPHAGGNWPKQLTLFGQFPTPALARCRSARENWAFLRKTPLAAASLLRPTVSVRAPWRFILFRQVRNSESLLRRGARVLGKPFFVRALADIDKPTYVAWSISYSSSRARIVLSRQSPAARQRNPVQTRTLRLNDFAT